MYNKRPINGHIKIGKTDFCGECVKKLLADCGTLEKTNMIKENGIDKIIDESIYNLKLD